MSDLTPNDVKENEFVYYEDPVTRQELKFLVIDVEDELLSNGFTCRLMLLDEPKRAIKTCNNAGSASFSVPRQIRQVADDAYKFRDEVGEWPSSDVILLSRCYTKQYGEVIEAVKEKLSLPDASTDFKVISKTEASAVADDCDTPFMSADKARELAENSLNVKERVALRIEDAAKSGEFETYLTDEEFKICKSDLVEHNYEVSNNRVSWGDQGDWGDYDA
jgi:hypothetical protein|nr:MAG TPA: hypothetical protein [Caudoviricetes sp.]